MNARPVVAASIGAGLFALVAGSSPAQAATHQASDTKSQSVSYIVSLDRTSRAVSTLADLQVQKSLNGKAFRGAKVALTPSQARELRSQPGVLSVEPNLAVHVEDVLSWGLDRIDQRDLPLDNKFLPLNTGAGTNAYVIDTGLATAHPEFAGRVGDGFDAIHDGTGVQDGHGHGTHVAGTIASTKYGIARAAVVHPVKVLNSDGSGYLDGVIAGINWVAANHKANSVANMSLGGSYSTALNSAVDGLSASGVPVVVAAGNSGDNACYYSPASAPSAITVGATDSSDSAAYFSNQGSCVDIFAPGVGITSTNYQDPNSSQTWDGTSMASPHVAGTVVELLSATPGLTVSQIDQMIKADATKNHISGTWSGTPNLLDHLGQGAGTPPPTPTPPTKPPTKPRPPLVTPKVTGSRKSHRRILKVAVSPSRGQVVRLQRLTAKGHWVNVTAKKCSPNGRLTFSLKPKSIYRVVVKATSTTRQVVSRKF